MPFDDRTAFEPAPVEAKPQFRDIYHERLARLVALLRTVPAGRFRLAIYWNRCGSTGCALGHAMHDPWFQKQGVRPCPEGIFPWFDSGLRENEGAAEFFNIPVETARRFFLGNAYPEPDRTNPLAVAARIEAYIKERYGDAG